MLNIVTEYFVSLSHFLKEAFKIIFIKCGKYALAMFTAAFIGDKIKNVKSRFAFLVSSAFGIGIYGLLNEFEN